MSLCICSLKILSVLQSFTMFCLCVICLSARCSSLGMVPGVWYVVLPLSVWDDNTASCCHQYNCILFFEHIPFPVTQKTSSQETQFVFLTVIMYKYEMSKASRLPIQLYFSAFGSAVLFFVLCLFLNGFKNYKLQLLEDTNPGIHIASQYPCKADISQLMFYLEWMLQERGRGGKKSGLSG